MIVEEYFDATSTNILPAKFCILYFEKLGKIEKLEKICYTLKYAYLCLR